MLRPLRVLRFLVVGLGFGALLSAQVVTNLTISNGTLTNVAGDGGAASPFNPSGLNPILPWSSIYTALGSGATLVRTSTGFNGEQNGDITIAQSPVGLSSANALTLTTASTGGIFLNAALANGGTGALTFNAGSRGISLGADVAASGGAQTYNGATLLTTAVSLSSTNSGAVSFASTVDGARNLTINTAGPITFAGAVGATTPLTQLGIGGGGPVAVNGGSITTSGILSLGAVTLGANTTLTSTANYVALDAVNGGNFALTVNNVLPGSMVSSTNLASLHKGGIGRLHLTGVNAPTNGTTIGAGYLTVGGGGTTGSLAGNVTFTGSLAAEGGELQFFRTDPITFSGNISGPGVVSNYGGTVTLGGANSYSGNTIVAAGVLASGGANSLSPNSIMRVASGATLKVNTTQQIGGLHDFTSGVSGSVVVENLATLVVANPLNNTFSGVISGAGGLLKGSTGELTLGGANTYTGTTAIAEGSLKLGASGSLPTGTNVSLFPSPGAFASLDLNGRSQTIGSLHLGGNGGSSSGLLLIGAGTLTLGGDVLFDANFNPGGALISGGTLALGATRMFMVGDSTATTSGAADLFVSSVISGPGFGLVKSGAGLMGVSGANTYTGGTTINNGILYVASNSALPVGGDVTVNNQFGSTSFLTINPGLTLSIGGLTFGGSGALSNSFNNVSIGIGSTLTLGGGVTYVATNNPRGALISGGTLSLGGATRTFDIADSTNLDAISDLTITSAIVGTSAEGITKTGTGKLVLSGTSTYTGTTTINNGRLLIGTNSSFPTGGAVVINRDGFSGAAVFDLAGHNVTVSSLTFGGAAEISGAMNNVDLAGGTLTLAGGVDYLVGAGSSPGMSSIFGGTLQLGAASRTFSVADSSAPGTELSISAVVAGSGGLIKTGSGVLALSGINTFTGTTTVNGGTLIVNSDASLGAAPASATPGQLTLDGGTLRAFSSVTLNSNRGVSLGASGGTFNLENGSSVTVGGIVAGGGALTKSGGGTLTLSGSNTFSGGTTITAGTLQLGGSSALAFDRAITIAAANPGDFATLNIGNFSAIPSSLTFGGQGNSRITMGSGDLTLNGSVAVLAGGAPQGATISGGSVFLTGMRSFSIGDSANAEVELSIFSPIGATGGITLNGAGALLLAGTNSFNGGVRLESGTLLVGQNNALGTGIVTVLTGGTLAARETNGLSAVTLSNDTVRIYTGTHLGSENSDATLKFTGAVELRGNDLNVDPVINLHLQGEAPTIFAGPLTTGRSNAVLQLQGGGYSILGGPVTGFTSLVADGAGMLFGSSSALAGSFAVRSTQSGYVGVLASAGSMPDPTRLLGTAALPGLIDRTNTEGNYAFAGTFGFDSDREGANAQTFRQNLDFSAMNAPTFRIGSATGAILAGTIKPSSDNGYVFGNGGGILVVQSNLSGSSGVRVDSTDLDRPLTLILRGNNTFADDLSIHNSAVILDAAHALPSAMPTGFRTVNLSGLAYFGATEKFMSSAANFAALFPGGGQNQVAVSGDSPTYSILGLDSHEAISARLNDGSRLYARHPVRIIGTGFDHLDLSALGGSSYLGTLTNIEIRDELIAPGGSSGTLRLAALHEGRLTVNSVLYQDHVGALVVGIPGLDTSEGVVQLGATNTYTGGTTLLGGALLVGADGALGTGQLTVGGSSSFARPVLAASSRSEVHLTNEIAISPNGLQLGQTEFEERSDFLAASRNALTLQGSISGPGGLFVANGFNVLTGAGPAPGGFGLLNLSGNSYTGGTTSDGGFLIFADANAIPATGLLRANFGGYIGAGFSTENLRADFLDRFDKLGTTGTIGLDHYGSGGFAFGDVDLTGFNFSARLGSATIADIQGTLTPSGNSYNFGGGGGKLTVSSALTGTRSLNVNSPATAPLTLMLTHQGDGSPGNTYTGATNVTHSALVFRPGSIPALNVSNSSQGRFTLNQGGYVGLQLYAGATSGEIGDFVSRFNAPGAQVQGFLGFDHNGETGAQLATSLNLSALGANIYLGTASSLTTSAALTFSDGNYRFAGYKGGELVVGSVLGGAASVTVGASNVPATYASPTGQLSTVQLTGANSYSGGTDFYAGRLRIGTNGALGSGALRVQPNNFQLEDTRLLQIDALTTLNLPVVLNADLSIGGTGNLTLSGLISGVGELYKVGNNTLTLSGANVSFAGGIYVAGGEVIFAHEKAAGTGPLQFGSSLESGAIFTTNASVQGIFTTGTNHEIGIAGGNTLTINQTFSSQYAGRFGGSGSILFQGPSASAPTLLRLTGSSAGAFSGGTTIAPGIAVSAANSGAFGSGAVTLAGGGLAVEHGTTLANALVLQSGTLGGTGVVSPSAPLQIGTGLVLAPGVGGVGTLSIEGGKTGAAPVLQLSGGGSYQWQLTDAANPAGGGWDGLYVFGGVSGEFGNVQIDATSANRFEIKIVTVTADGAAGLAANFNPTQAYSWPFLTATGGITVNGGAALNSVFSINTSAFSNSLSAFGNTGIFDVGLSNIGGIQQLSLNFTPVPEPSTYALMGAGLLAVGFALRRRRSARG